jgi:hypothetical protein
MTQRFRGRKTIGACSVTVPTVIQYYYHGQVRAVGAETESNEDENMYEAEGEEDYVVAERYELRYANPSIVNVRF